MKGDWSEKTQWSRKIRRSKADVDRRWSDEAKAKQSKARKGKKMSAETKNKISATLRAKAAKRNQSTQEVE